MSDHKPYDPLGVSAQLDQALAGQRDLATAIEGFRTSLLAAGTPEVLAHRLIVEWCRLLWIKSCWPDRPPTLGEE